MKLTKRKWELKNNPRRGTTHYLVTSTSRSHPNIFDRTLLAPFVALTPRFVSPNAVTIFRMVVLPLVLYYIWTAQMVIGLCLFVIAAFSDMLDGALARTRNQITDWGKLFDPVADKMLVGSVAAIVITRYLNLWLVFSIILIETLLIVSAIFLRGRRRKPIQARFSGKVKMILQCFGLGFILIYGVTPIVWLLPLATATLWLAVLFGLLSLVVYRSI